MTPGRSEFSGMHCSCLDGAYASAFANRCTPTPAGVHQSRALQENERERQSQGWPVDKVIIVPLPPSQCLERSTGERVVRLRQTLSVAVSAAPPRHSRAQRCQSRVEVDGPRTHCWGLPWESTTPFVRFLRRG